MECAAALTFALDFTLISMKRRKNNNIARVRELHSRIMRISSTIYSVGRCRSSFLKGLKCALSCLGICHDSISEPFHPFALTERERIREHLLELGLMESHSA